MMERWTSLRAASGDLGCVLPPVVALEEGPALERVSLCSPALLALVDRPARVLVLQADRLVLDARVETGSDPTGCLS